MSIQIETANKIINEYTEKQIKQMGYIIGITNNMLRIAKSMIEKDNKIIKIIDGFTGR